MLKELSALFLALLLVPSSSRAEHAPVFRSFESRGFEQIARRHGVTVYKHRDSEIIRIGATARFHAPLARVQHALLDYRGQVGFIERLSERPRSWSKEPPV